MAAQNNNNKNIMVNILLCGVMYARHEMKNNAYDVPAVPPVPNMHDASAV